MAIYDYKLGALGSESKLSANDAELSQTIVDGDVEYRLPNGNLVRYVLYSVYQWSFVYSWIYGSKQYQYDGGLGRNDLYTLYTTKTEYSFLVPNDQGVQTAYTVRFALNSWKEDLKFRNGDKTAWQLSFDLLQAKV